MLIPNLTIIRGVCQDKANIDDLITLSKHMKQPNKYDTSGMVEAQHEPGSRGRVLKNKLGIKLKREMDKAELDAQMLAHNKLAGMYTRRHQFSAKDICRMHKIWLGDIYEWAGKYRKVNLTKDEFPFAAAAHVPRLMEDFEESHLAKHTPCQHKTIEETAEAIARVHVEFLLIHPFREGNGRVARMLADLMASQDSYPFLDYTTISKGGERKSYFLSVQEGINNNYKPMVDFFIEIITKTLRQGAGRISSWES